MATSDHEAFARSSDETSSDPAPLSAHRGAAGHAVLQPEARLSVLAAILVLSFASCFVAGLSVGTLVCLVCISAGDHFFGLLATEPDPVETAAEARQATGSSVVTQQRPGVGDEVLIQDSWLPMVPRPAAG